MAALALLALAPALCGAGYWRGRTARTSAQTSLAIGLFLLGVMALGGGVALGFDRLLA